MLEFFLSHLQSNKNNRHYTYKYWYTTILFLSNVYNNETVRPVRDTSLTTNWKYAHILLSRKALRRILPGILYECAIWIISVL